MTDVGRQSALVAGGSFPPGAHTWMARLDLSLYAVASPFGADPIAARIALDRTAEALGQPLAYQSAIEKPLCARLRGAIWAAGESWERSLETNTAQRGLGATLAAVLLAPEGAAVAHLGDCRVVQIRAGVVVRKTTDHVSHLEDGRTAVERTVGRRSNPEVQAWPVASGDLFLLSAGVHEVVPEEDVLACLLGDSDLSVGIGTLVELARRSGGRDQLSAVAVRASDAVAR